MNLDQRSMFLNTEIGVIIDSAALAQEIASRFQAMAQPVKSCEVTLRPQMERGVKMLWHTHEHGNAVEYQSEPARGIGQRLNYCLLPLLSLDAQL